MDDLATGLDRAKRQPWLTRSTGVMLGLVLGCAGFLAGVKAQQSYGSTGTTVTQPPVTRQAPVASPTVSGKIKLVDGTTVYVETADGRIVTVKTTETTTVTAPAVLQDLTAGATVTVTGSGTDTITATSIMKTN